MKPCNIFLENNQRCNKTFNLHIVYFINPFDPDKSNHVTVCGLHYDAIIKEINEELIILKRKLDNAIYQDKLQRKTCKENDVIYTPGYLQFSIESMRERLKKLSLDECRNFFCKARLERGDPTKKLYSVTSFKPSGRRHNTFYLCSLKCFNIMKGKFSIETIIINKQRTLI